MATATARTDLAKVVDIAERAIVRRLGYSRGIVVDARQDGDAVLLHLNSGGNACAASAALRAARYAVTDTDTPFGRRGAALLVLAITGTAR